MRRLYDWIMRLAASDRALPALGIIAFIESSVFPIPPDVLLIPMVIAAPRQAWRYAAVATAASVAGGFLGYAIGYYAFGAVGQPILEFYGVMDRYYALKDTFDQWGAWVIMLKGMTPIPYKLVTITSGALHFDLVAFGLASIVSRAVRFFLVAALLYFFGPHDFTDTCLHRAAIDPSHHRLRRSSCRAVSSPCAIFRATWSGPFPFTFLFVASLLIVGGALLFQYVGGLQPCELCLYQRWPYYTVAGFAFLGAADRRAPRQPRRAGARCALCSRSALCWPSIIMSGSSSIGSPVRAPARLRRSESELGRGFA